MFMLIQGRQAVTCSYGSVFRICLQDVVALAISLKKVRYQHN